MSPCCTCSYCSHVTRQQEAPTDCLHLNPTTNQTVIAPHHLTTAPSVISLLDVRDFVALVRMPSVVMCWIVMLTHAAPHSLLKATKYFTATHVQHLRVLMLTITYCCEAWVCRHPTACYYLYMYYLVRHKNYGKLCVHGCTCFGAVFGWPDSIPSCRNCSNRALVFSASIVSWSDSAGKSPSRS